MSAADGDASKLCAVCVFAAETGRVDTEPRPAVTDTGDEDNYCREHAETMQAAQLGEAVDLLSDIDWRFIDGVNADTVNAFLREAAAASSWTHTPDEVTIE
ncbi:hypothetical protein [Halobaculum sp. D14]|uniref:hypothetical protein n=1 Tax=Halobaculum sp. D14 TaxID=3421642 RepID=UPI003EB71A5F